MRWTDEEKMMMRLHYHAIGPDGMMDLLPGRGRKAIISKAHVLGLSLNPQLRAELASAGVTASIARRRTESGSLARSVMEATLPEIERMALYGRRV